MNTSETIKQAEAVIAAAIKVSVKAVEAETGLVVDMIAINYERLPSNTLVFKPQLRLVSQ